MTTAGVSELKARLSRYLAAVAAGEEVLITDRGRPVARLVGVGPQPSGVGTEEAGRLRKLERAGLLRVGAGEISDAFWSLRRGEDPASTVLQALLDERGAGR